MSSSCSIREEMFDEERRRLGDRNEVNPRRSDFIKTRSYDNHFNLDVQNAHIQQIRRSVADQIEHIDTGLPQLDFVKLEKQLTTAAKEREDVEKRMTADNMIEKETESDRWRRYPSFQHHKKTNSILRLPPSKNLQVCFMNELSETETNGEESEDSDMEHSYVRKSKSAPNFKNAANLEILDMKALKDLTEKLENNLVLNETERCKMLRHEARRVVKIAEEKAKVSLAEYRRGRSKASEIPRQARQYLSKTKLTDIKIIHRQIEEAINRKNNELVKLLLERDNLHMEHDSLRVDIDDYTQQKSPLIFLDMKRLFHLQNGLEQNTLQAI
uniref:SCHIP-1 domain-containing protein n=2 Tax=Caenorhabditis tropicalis TaxID=1561998 RepID=A0A1I7SZV2_9PELO